MAALGFVQRRNLIRRRQSTTYCFYCQVERSFRGGTEIGESLVSGECLDNESFLKDSVSLWNKDTQADRNTPRGRLLASHCTCLGNSLLQYGCCVCCWEFGMSSRGCSSPSLRRVNSGKSVVSSSRRTQAGCDRERTEIRNSRRPVPTRLHIQ